MAEERGTEGRKGAAWLSALTLILLGGALWWARPRAVPSAAVEPVKAPAVQAAAGFAPTVPLAVAAPEPAPKGMAWIPGGEFSMGAEDPRGAEHGGHDPMADTRPIHRVSV